MISFFYELILPLLWSSLYHVIVTDITWPLTLCNLWIFLGSSPIGNHPWSYSSLLIVMLTAFIPLSPTPYLYNQGYTILLLWWPHTGLTSLISTFIILFHSLTLSFYVLYIVDHMYTHVIIELVLKAARANKELYSSSLVISPSKEHKQDRINPTFINPFLYSHYGLAIGLGGCTSWVGCWVVTLVSCPKYVIPLLSNPCQFLSHLQ